MARPSLNVRLPLMIAGVLLIVLLIFGILIYRMVSRAELDSASARLENVASQIAGSISQDAGNAIREVETAAGDPAVLAYVRGEPGTEDAARLVLRGVQSDTTAGSAVEIRDADGGLRLAAGRPSAIDSVAAAAARDRPDSAAISPLFRADRFVFYEVTAPINTGSGSPWHLVVRRRLGDASGGRRLESMIGRGTRLFVGNAGDSLWTALGAPPESVLIEGVIRNGSYSREGVDRMGATSPAPGSPWLLAAESPRREALSGVRALMENFAAAAALVLALGAGLGWLTSRRLTRPLARLTDAAEHVSRASANDPAPTARGDEISRLSESFGTMVARVNEGQERLLASESQYRMLFDLNPDPMWVYDLKTLAFLAVNEAAVKKYGYTHEEFLGMTIRDIRPAAEVPRLLEAVETEFETRPGVSRWHHVTRDGTVLDVEIRGRPVMFAGREGELVLVRDVTERNRWESRFRQTQKMEAFGRLAGGIAHDFNNILSAVMGYADLLLDDLPEKDPRRQDVEEISEAALRGASLTRQLLTFSRQEVAELHVLDLNEAVRGVVSMLRRIIGEDIRVEARLDPGIGRVEMDPGHLEQVVMNLAVNARDAMPGGGTLTIETADVDLDEVHQHGSRALPAGRYVMLAVTDVGVGIAREQQARIFEPFYTTKAPGEGTGLGLSMVYGIVQQTGGSVLVYSEPGDGATFKVYLPRVSRALDVPAVPASRPVGGVNHETILFVEDEPALRRMGHTILTREGYTVLTMSSADEALTHCEQYDGRIDLIATDMVMPGLNGRELVDRLHRSRPESKVLFMSGYTDDSIIQRGILQPGTAFLQKPFSAVGLARKIRQVLDGQQGVASSE